VNIMIHLESDLISKAIHQLFITNAYDDVVVDGRSPANGFTPEVLLVDISTVTRDLLARDPRAKALLIDDAGREPEQLCAALLSYRMTGAIPPHAGLHQVWIENGSVKAVRHDTGALSQARKQARSRAGRRRSLSASATG
jgi:hypothetical protein